MPYHYLVKQGFLVSTNKQPVLEGFQLFYEELNSSRITNRIRRKRMAA